MKFKELLSRIAGLSVPVFGIQWAPSEADVTAARRIITYLEDRRVLYSPDEMESPEYCVRSVLEIRGQLTRELGAHATGDLAESLRAMRASCRKFLNCMDRGDGEIVRHGRTHGHWASWAFNSALGELRGVMGIHLARLAAQHGLDIEGELASILPETADDEGSTLEDEDEKDGPKLPRSRRKR